MLIYFLSDAHLGCRALRWNRTRERRLVRFLDSIKTKATAVYLLGDMFDYWFEYRQVVPKGHVRFLGKIAELTDRGVEVHFFIGNHDIWCHNYLKRECGVIMHYEPYTVEIEGKVFYMAHGDGLGDEADKKFHFLRRLFHSRFCQRAFYLLHPDWSVRLGLKWAANSRRKHDAKGEPTYKGEENEPLVVFSKHYLATHPEINYFLYGHRHIELDLPLSDECRMLILGDWVEKFTFATFDGEKLIMQRYLEGETRP